MSIEITHVRYSGNQRTHESIIEYKWKNVNDGNTGASTKAVLVEWVDDSGTAYVGSGKQRVQVVTVHPTNTLPYLRTQADGRPTNNLLSLPTF